MNNPGSDLPKRPVRDPRDLTIELLADLHAGVLDDAEARLWWPVVSADPRASAVLHALDAAVTDAAQLRTGRAEAPSVPMPAHVATRLADALAAAEPPVARPTRSRREVHRAAAHPHRRPGWPLLPGALAVAAALVVVFVLPSQFLAPRTVEGSAQAQPLQVVDGQLGTAVVASLGARDLGPLQDPAVLAGCLRANGVAPSAPLLGASEVVLGGRAGVLLLLPAASPGVITAVVVGPGCSAGDAALLTRQQIGR